MSIEKDLQQTKPFIDDHHRAVVNILFTSRYLESQLKKAYKKHGITMKQYNILRILRGAGKPLSTQKIGERMIDRMSDISRIVDRMIEKHYVSKCTNTTDKRLVDITISATGMELLTTIDEEASIQQRLMQNLSISESNTLNKILDKIRGYNN